MKNKIAKQEVKQSNPFDNFPDTFFVLEDNNENDLFYKKTFIGTELGGKGDKIRYYVVVSKKHAHALTAKDKKKLSEALHTVVEAKKSQIEDIVFGKSYMLIKIVISIHTELQDVIDAFLDIGSREMKILRYHFYSINTHKPTKRDILEYIKMNEVKLLGTTQVLTTMLR